MELLFFILCGMTCFTPGANEYDQISFIISTLGNPPNNMLRNIRKACKFFSINHRGNQWTLKVNVHSFSITSHTTCKPHISNLTSQISHTLITPHITHHISLLIFLHLHIYTCIYNRIHDIISLLVSTHTSLLTHHIACTCTPHTSHPTSHSSHAT